MSRRVTIRVLLFPVKLFFVALLMALCVFYCGGCVLCAHVPVGLPDADCRHALWLRLCLRCIRTRR